LQSTTFAVVIGAVFTLIAGWSGRADILVASHWTGRHRRQVQNLIGCFAQLRALRVKLDPFDTFADVVTKVHATQQEDLPYLKLPYQRIRERILSSENRASPAEILVNYVPLGGASMPDRGDSKIGMLGEIEDLHWRLAAPLVDNRNFRLYLTFEETPDYLNWFVRFSGKFFSDSTIDAISLDLQAVLENVSSNPSRRLSAIRVPRLEAQAASVSGARVPASAS
jgi:hypothetical protein